MRYHFFPLEKLVLKSIPETTDQKDTIRDHNGSISRYRAQGEAACSFEPVALTYDSANAVFNVSSYSGALLLQAGARKAATAASPQRNVARRAGRRGCIMHAVLHNYRVVGKLYDYAHLASINFLFLSLSLSFSFFLSLEHANLVTGIETENNPEK